MKWLTYNFIEAHNQHEICFFDTESKWHPICVDSFYVDDQEVHEDSHSTLERIVRFVNAGLETHDQNNH